MQITITITCDNAAFGESGRGATAEVERILAKVVRGLDQQVDLRDYNGIKLRDINGNTVGRITVVE